MTGLGGPMRLSQQDTHLDPHRPPHATDRQKWAARIGFLLYCGLGTIHILSRSPDAYMMALMHYCLGVVHLLA